MKMQYSKPTVKRYGDVAELTRTPPWLSFAGRLSGGDVGSPQPVDPPPFGGPVNSDPGLGNARGRGNGRGRFGD